MQTKDYLYIKMNYFFLQKNNTKIVFKLTRNNYFTGKNLIYDTILL